MHPSLHPRRLLLAGLLVLALLLALIGQHPFHAAAASASITLSAYSGKPGQTITVHGRDFGPGEAINLALGSTPLGSTHSTLTGRFTTAFTVPVVLPAPYVLTATGASSGDVVSVNFTIPVFTSITLSTSVSFPGGYIVVKGSGFASQENVSISLGSAVVGQGQAASNGKLATSFVIPTSTLPGTYSVAATGQSSTLSASASLLISENWPEAGYNPSHTRDNPFEQLLTPGNVATLSTHWSFSTRALVVSSPAVVNGVVYIGSFDGNVYALDATTGSKLWSFTTGNAVQSSPAVVNGVVYIGSFDGNVYALNAATGTKLWSFTTGDPVASSPAVANGVVYVGSEDSNVYALKASTGTKLWSFKTGDPVDSSPAVANGVVYVGSNDQNVYALDATTGTRLWNFPVRNSIFSSPAVANGVVYIGSDEGNVYALKASTGVKLWSFTTGGGVRSSPAVANGVVYVGSDDQNVYALNATTGALLWRFASRSVVDSSPAVANGVVYVGSEDDNVYALDATTGTKLWNFPVGIPIFSSPAVANGIVYIGSEDDNVYAFGLSPSSDAHRGSKPARTATPARSLPPSATMIGGEENGWTRLSQKRH